MVRATGFCALTAFFSLVGVRHTQDAVANGDTRTISIVHMHTKETLTVTFRRNGQYDQQALQQLNWALRDWRLDQPTRMDPRLFDIAWEVHREVGSSQPFHVVSAYRSPGTNSMLRRRSRGVAKHSQHMEGKAMDFYLPDVSPATIRSVGMKLQRGGVGYYPSAYTPFIHLDVGSVRSWPRMTRDQLARLFPDGRTVHIPADGQPLSGYEVAKAEILSRGGSVAGYASADVDEGAAMQGRGRSLWASIFGWNEEDESRPATARGRAAQRGQQPAMAYAPAPPTTGESTNMYAVFQPPAEIAAAPATRQPLARGRAAPQTQVAAAPAEEPQRTAARSEARPEPQPATPRLVNAPLPTARPTNLGAVQLASVQPGSPAERLNWQQGAQAIGSDAVEMPVRLVNAPLPPARPEALLAALPAAQAPVASDASAPQRQDPAPRLVTVNHPAPPERPRAAVAAARRRSPHARSGQSQLRRLRLWRQSRLRATSAGRSITSSRPRRRARSRSIRESSSAVRATRSLRRAGRGGGGAGRGARLPERRRGASTQPLQRSGGEALAHHLHQPLIRRSRRPPAGKDRGWPLPRDARARHVS